MCASSLIQSPIFFLFCQTLFHFSWVRVEMEDQQLMKDLIGMLLRILSSNLRSSSSQEIYSSHKC